MALSNTVLFNDRPTRIRRATERLWPFVKTIGDATHHYVAYLNAAKKSRRVEQLVDELLEARDIRCGCRSRDPRRHLHVDPGAFDRLTRLVRSLQPNSNGDSLFRDAEAASELMLGDYVEAIAAAEPSTAKAIRRRAAYRYEVVRRADAAMRNLVARPFLSTHFCKCLGMSERNLELHFHEALGVSPKAWFQYLSLHKARTMLRYHAPSRGSVTDTALACGFEHFGRFSEAYRKLFGEPPSQTLRSSLLQR